MSLRSLADDMPEAPAKPEAPKAVQNPFSVVPEKCIGCDACADEFETLFEMVEDGAGRRKAVAKENPKPGKWNARAVVTVCPTEAITTKGKLPPIQGTPDALLTEAPGWEAKWAAHRFDPDDAIERMRRYGRDFTVEEKEGYLLLTVRFPSKVPPWRDKYRFGLPDVLPLYTTMTEVEEDLLTLRAYLTDPKIRAALCFGANSFPDRFSVAVRASKPIVGVKEHYDAHQVLEIAAFTDAAVMEAFRWPAHYITDACTGCTVCARVCPTNAITGDQKLMHYIDPVLCINCSVCGVYCPFDAIVDQGDTIVPRILPREIPKAVVIEDLCTGCEFCIHVCPFDCIWLESPDGDATNPVKIAVVDEKKCISCKLCEQVCIKGAIVVPRDQEFPDIGWSYQAGAW